MARNSTALRPSKPSTKRCPGQPRNHDPGNHHVESMQVERLRLTGFKSFVEPTELAIEPGLTGVVGPNGCGKSNLIEALRWVMGETSARQMRGGEMDDVIFGGTSDRPSRNLAEVLLGIDNTDRRAPAAFKDLEDIE